jgi:hypothetical protein
MHPGDANGRHRNGFPGRPDSHPDTPRGAMIMRIDNTDVQNALADWYKKVTK